MSAKPRRDTADDFPVERLKITDFLILLDDLAILTSHQQTESA